MVAKKTLAIITIAILAVSVVATTYYILTLPPSTPTPETITIRIMDGWNHEGDSEAMQLHMEKYMELNPHIKFDQYLVGVPQQVVAYAADKAAGTPPHLVNTYAPDVAVWYQDEELLPLDNLIEDLGGEAFLPEESLEDIYWDGHYWMLLDIYATFNIGYRKDLFRQYNITVPTTWDELLEAARTLTRDTDDDGKIDLWGIGIFQSRTYMTAELLPLSLLWANNANLVDAAGNVIIDSPEAIEALEFLAEISQYSPPDSTEWGWTEQRRAYYEGRLAMCVNRGSTLYDTTWTKNPKIGVETGVMTLPYGPSGSLEKCSYKYLSGAVCGWSMTKYAEEAGIVEECEEFLEWLYQPDQWFERGKRMPVREYPWFLTCKDYEKYWEIPQVQHLEDALVDYAALALHNREINKAAGVFSADAPTLCTGLYFTDMIQEITIAHTTVSEAVAKYKPIMEEALK